ncbi:MAG: hypothetical protein HY913_14680 [Desulfomonile tiedjei]|nr:hypothetical protein [Desulfomonile tiedjei]
MRSYDTRNLGPGNFWVGAAAMAFFGGASLLAGYWGLEEIHLEWLLGREGISITGIVVGKTSEDWDDPPSRNYYLLYTFRADSKTITKRASVDEDLWLGVKEKGPISIIYVPGKPELNLPEPLGRYTAASFLFLTTMLVAAGVLFTAILVLMIYRKSMGHYRAAKWFVTADDLAKHREKAS